MRATTVNIDSLNIGSILWVTPLEGKRIIGKVNGLIREKGGYNVSIMRYDREGVFVKFRKIDPVDVTDDFLTDNFDRDEQTGLWNARLGEELGMEIFQSPDERYDNYVFNLFDDELHTFCSLEFKQVHQLQNILHYFNVEYKLDVSSYTGSK